jgi:hypothetical protein
MSDEILLYLYSNQSSSCQQIQPAINAIAPFFNTKMINIDNPQVLQIIQNASRTKINSVPSALLIYPTSNKVEQYEGNNLLTLIINGLSMVEKRKNKNTDDSRRVTSVDSEINDVKESDQPEPSKFSKVGKRNIYPDVSSGAGGRHLNTVGRDSVENLPVKGQGHENMGSSSLPGAPRGNENGRRITAMQPDYDASEDEFGRTQAREIAPKVPVKVGKTTKMIEDLSDYAEDENAGMSMDDILPRDANAGPSKESTKKVEVIKSASEQMMREREAMMSGENSRR